MKWINEGSLEGGGQHGEIQDTYGRRVEWQGWRERTEMIKVDG